MKKVLTQEHARRIRILLAKKVGTLHLDQATMNALATYKDAALRTLVLKHQSLTGFSAKHSSVTSGLIEAGKVTVAAVEKLEKYLHRCGMSLDDDLAMYDE